MSEPINESTSFFSEIFPVITLLIGLITTPFFQRISENKRLGMVEKYFIELLDSLHIQIGLQNSEIRNCISKIDDKTKFDLVLNKVSDRNLELIDRLDSKDLFKIVVLRKKGKKEKKAEIFKEINSIIAFFNESIPNALSANTKSIRFIDTYRSEWNLSQKNLLKLKNLLTVNNNLRNIGKGEDPFFDTFCEKADWFFKNHGKDKQNIFIANEKLIDPLFELAAEHTLDPRAAGLLVELQDSRLACMEMENTRNLMSSFLLKNVEDNERLNNNMKNVIIKIKELKNKLI